ncbi:MAG: ketopantoate reductase family protein [Thermoplasmata archaeon]
MKILIYGAGALGCGIASMISNNNLYFIGREGTVNAINNGNMHISGLTNKKIEGKAYISIEDMQEVPDIIFITTKAYDTEKAIKEIVNKWKNVYITHIQNGLVNRQIIYDYIYRYWGNPKELFASCVTNYGFTKLNENNIKHAGNGTLWIEDCKTGQIINELFNQTSVNHEIINNIEEQIWKKGIVNSVINPLTCIFNAENEVLGNPYLSDVIGKIVKEGVEVAKSTGIVIKYDEVISLVKSTINWTSKNVSSMLQDMRNGKKLEIEEINGYILSVGSKNGINVEYNTLLYKITKVLEKIHKS